MGTADTAYRERPSALPGAVVWARGDLGEGATQRVLPDGCVDLMWADGELVVAGPDTTAWLATARPGVRFAAVRFAPGTGPAVLGVPADELRDRRVELSRLWPGPVARRLGERLAEAPHPAAALERALLEHWRPPEPWVGLTIARLRSGDGVDAIAAEVGLSERQLLRRCQHCFGYGPKTLQRILRLDRALGLARCGTAFGEVASLAGYADQAHLAREVKALAGVPLSRLLAAPRTG